MLSAESLDEVVNWRDVIIEPVFLLRLADCGVAHAKRHEGRVAKQIEAQQFGCLPPRLISETASLNTVASE